MTPLAAMAAPENRRCPTRVHVLRLAPMTDLWLPEDGASGTNPWWLTAEANRSSLLPLQNRCPVCRPFTIYVLAMASRAVNGGQKPPKSGAAKNWGARISGLEPGQGRAPARRSEPLTRRRAGYAGAWL